MTTPAQGNLSGTSAKPPESFEASGLSPDEADRLAAAFKPSWELDDAPFAPGGGLHAAELEGLAAGGVNGDVRDHGHDSSRSIPPHAPPARVETHEPEVSVIIDRSITASEMEAQGQRPQPHAPPPPAPFPAPVTVAGPFAAQSPFAAPAPFAAPSRPMPQRPVSRASADDSLEIPAALKKSNKGLFIGLGVAVAGAVLVLGLRAATSSDTESASPAATMNVSTATATATQIPPIPPVPAAPTVPAGPAAHPDGVSVQNAPRPAPIAAAPTPPVARPAPRPHEPRATPVPQPRHAAPRTPPKQSGGGIVRDVPF